MRDLLTDAIHEIRSLRRQNEILSAKVEVMDFFAMVLHTTPAQPSQGFSPDVAYALEQEVAKLDAKKPEPPLDEPLGR